MRLASPRLEIVASLHTPSFFPKHFLSLYDAGSAPLDLGIKESFSERCSKSGRLVGAPGRG